jgi:hypothetical protein
MKRTLSVFAFICALCVSTQAQADIPGLLDAFGDIQTSDLMARLDNLAIELQHTPQSRGFIVSYSQPNKFPGWPLRRALWCKSYLIAVRGIEPERVLTVNGGFRDDIRFELWVEPPRAQPPVQQFDLAAELASEKTPYLFDRVFVFESSPGVPEMEEYNYLDDKGFYEPFVMTLRNDPAARGLLIAYSTRRDRRGEDSRLAARRKLAIMKSQSIGADRIVAVGGGQREQKTIEFWIVPPGAELPKPTPNVRTVRRKRR